MPSPAEVRTTRGAIEPAWAAFVDVLAYAGLQIGETAPLQVGDIDRLRRSIHVQRQMQNCVGGLDIIGPENQSERVVPPVPDELLQRLSRHIDAIGVRGRTLEVWSVTVSEGPISTTSSMRAALQASQVSPHDLLHHYVSGLIRGGSTQ